MRAKLNVSSASISYVCINNIIKIKPNTYLPLFKPAKKKKFLFIVGLVKVNKARIYRSKLDL